MYIDCEYDGITKPFKRGGNRCEYSNGNLSTSKNPTNDNQNQGKYTNEKLLEYYDKERFYINPSGWDERRNMYCTADTSDSPFGPNATEEYCPMFGLTGEDHPKWDGGDPVYGEGWNENKKEKIRDRHNRRCADPDCRVHEDELDEKLHVHHILPARLIDDDERRNDPDNLVALCSSCHLGKWEKLSVEEQRELMNTN